MRDTFGAKNISKIYALQSRFLKKWKEMDWEQKSHGICGRMILHHFSGAGDVLAEEPYSINDHDVKYFWHDFNMIVDLDKKEKVACKGGYCTYPCHQAGGQGTMYSIPIYDSKWPRPTHAEWQAEVKAKAAAAASSSSSSPSSSSSSSSSPSSSSSSSSSTQLTAMKRLDDFLALGNRSGHHPFVAPFEEAKALRDLISQVACAPASSSGENENKSMPCMSVCKFGCKTSKGNQPRSFKSIEREKKHYRAFPHKLTAEAASAKAKGGAQEQPPEVVALHPVNRKRKGDASHDSPSSSPSSDE
jgi:hypothetical protein